MKILFCIVGISSYGVIESDIIKRDNMVISAKRAFMIELDQSQTIKTPNGMRAARFIISIFQNVTMNCFFISEMAKDSAFYQEIQKIVIKESVNEN